MDLLARFLIHDAHVVSAAILYLFTVLLLPRSIAFGSFRGLVAASPVFFLTLMGYVSNNLLDVEKDRAAGKCNPLALGVLTRSFAIAFCTCCVALAFALAAYCAPPRLEGVLVVITIIFILYTGFARALPSLKGLYVSMMCCAPFVVAWSFSGRMSKAEYLAFYVLFLWGRETLLDARDAQSDRAFGMNTLPSILSHRGTVLCSWLPMIGGSLGLLLLVRFPISIALATASFAIVVGSCCFHQQRYALAQRATRIAGLFGVIAIGVSP